LEPTPGLVEQTLYDISSPDHHRYGKHLKKDELKELLRPDVRATQAVHGWLEKAGINHDKVIDRGEMISFHATVAQAEFLLGTKFSVYQSTKREVQRVRALNYTIPANLHQYIETVQPVTRFGHIREQSPTQVLDGPDIEQDVGNYDCNNIVTPKCLRELYGVPLLSPTLGNTTFLGVAGFLEQYARHDDLHVFEKTLARYMGNETFEWTSVSGGQLPQDSKEDSREANLDMQYGMAMAWPVRARYYSVPGRGPLVSNGSQSNRMANTNEPYLDFLTYMMDLPDKQLPTVLSMSYGEPEQSVPEGYSRVVCNMLRNLGLRGVSIVLSSGDDGPGEDCISSDGKNTTRFQPIFPASCPFVTSVGGTRSVDGSERAAELSSGGFSERFPRPEYQDDAIKDYLSKLGSNWEGLYNARGRGFPDVAAQAYNFAVFDKGRITPVSGTSASAPVFAGMIALLNAARIQKGMPPLGFLNPLLYGKGDLALDDIDEGGSIGCSKPSKPTVPLMLPGWQALRDWDPVTGLGTMNFTSMYNLVMEGKAKLVHTKNGTAHTDVPDNHGNAF